MPDATLRAALVLLLGTSGAPAITAITDDPLLLEVYFGPLESPGVVAGKARIRPGFESAGKRVIIVNDRYRYEDPALLSQVLFHEALHLDDESAREEAVVLAFLGELVHAEAQVDFPEIGRLDTALPQSTRTTMLAVLINSRTPFESRGELFPGNSVSPSASLFDDSSYASVPAHATLGSEQFLRTLQNLGLEFDGIPNYSRDLLMALDIASIIDSVVTRLTAADIAGIAERNGISLD